MKTVILPNNFNSPSNLDQAIEIIKKNTNEKDIDYIKSLTEDECSALAHMSFARGLRNNWYLWWSKKLAKDYKEKNYPQEKPTIVSFFHDLGIYHADDMSGIIVSSFYRDLQGAERDLAGQVQHYIQFWEEQNVNLKEEYEKAEAE